MWFEETGPSIQNTGGVFSKSRTPLKDSSIKTKLSHIRKLKGPIVWGFIEDIIGGDVDIFNMSDTHLNQLTNTLEKKLGRAMKTPTSNIAKNRNDSGIVKAWVLYCRELRL